MMHVAIANNTLCSRCLCQHVTDIYHLETMQAAYFGTSMFCLMTHWNRRNNQYYAMVNTRVPSENTKQFDAESASVLSHVYINISQMYNCSINMRLYGRRNTITLNY